MDLMNQYRLTFS